MIPALTPRQHQALACLGRGLSNAAIAAELGCAIGTAKLYVQAVLAALGVRNRTEAALRAQQLAGGLTAEEVSLCHQHAAEVRALLARLRGSSIEGRAPAALAGVEFIEENGGGPGVRLRKGGGLGDNRLPEPSDPAGQK